MPSRAELELRAASVNVVAANYKSDSSLEQAVIYAEQNAAAATGTGTRLVAPATKTQVSGGKNV
jgi:hypothetical protein